MISSSLKVQTGSASAPLGPRAVSPVTEVEPVKKQNQNKGQDDAVIKEYFNQSSQEIREELAENFLADTYQAYKEGIERARIKAEREREIKAQIQEEQIAQQQVRDNNGSTERADEAPVVGNINQKESKSKSQVDRVQDAEEKDARQESTDEAEVATDRRQKLGVSSYEKQLQVELSFYEKKGQEKSEEGGEESVQRFKLTA